MAAEIKASKEAEKIANAAAKAEVKQKKMEANQRDLEYRIRRGYDTKNSAERLKDSAKETAKAKTNLEHLTS